MLRHIISIGALTCMLSTAASAATVSFSSGSFNASLDINASDSGDFSFGAPVAVTGLQQFDSNLGMLTGVSFAVSPGTFDWSANMFGDPSIGSNFTGEFEASIQADLAYITGTSGAVLTGIADSVYLFCEGDETIGDTCDDGNGNTFDFSTDSFNVPRPLTDFDLNDLVGNGDVANLRLGINLFDASFITNDGLDSIAVDGLAEILNATVTVTYEYNSMPAVPVPAAVWLFGSGLIGLIGVARRKKA